MYTNIMDKFVWGNMDYTEGNGVYLDENNRRMITNIRLQFSNLADELVAQGKDEKALKVLQKLLDVTPEKNVPYDRVLMPVAETLMLLAATDTSRTASEPLSAEQKAQALASGEALTLRLFELFEQDMYYYLSLEERFFNQTLDDLSILYQVNGRLLQIVERYNPNSTIKDEMRERLEAIDSAIEAKEQALRDLGSVSF
jgi:tetratricopeptide (TPR) repeat protein